MKISIKLFTFLTLFGFALGNINLANADETSTSMSSSNEARQQNPTGNLQPVKPTTQKTTPNKNKNSQPTEGNAAVNNSGSSSNENPTENLQPVTPTTQETTPNKNENSQSTEGNAAENNKDASESYLFGLTCYQLFGIATLTTAIVNVVYHYYGYKSEETDDADDE